MSGHFDSILVNECSAVSVTLLAEVDQVTLVIVGRLALPWQLRCPRRASSTALKPVAASAPCRPGDKVLVALRRATSRAARG